MPVRLSEVLAHPVVRRGRPTVLAAADRLDREVRWLHSSDIFEIAPLLRSDDLLLTTGLGLLGRGPEDARSFVRDLAQRGVAGLVLETCRFYTVAPPEMVAEAERVGLPMVGFDSVVPFVEVTEAVNAVIVDAAVHRLRHADEVSQQLSSVLVGGGGVPEVLERLATVLGGPVEFARAGAASRHTNDTDDTDSADDLPDAVAVVVHGAVAGWLRTRLEEPDRLLGEAALERASTALSLAMLRDEHAATATLSGRGHLAGLLLDAGADHSAVRSALRTAGLPASAEHYVTAVGTGPDPGGVTAVLHRACSRAGPAVPSTTAVAPGTSVVVSVLAVVGEVAPVLDELLRALWEATPLARLDATAAIGPVAPSVADLGRSVREARLALGAVWARAPRTRVIDCRRVGVERALLRGHDGDELRAMAAEHLGPLLAYDERHHSRLVETLRVLLDSTNGKSGAAAGLHIRRQSLYQRLARIERVLAVDLHDEHVRASLLVALRALDLTRSAVDTPG